MPNVAPTELTDRQRSLLRGVVEEHITTGQPVGSRTLVEPQPEHDAFLSLHGVRERLELAQGPPT